jgi:predicted nucleotidyltransferase
MTSEEIIQTIKTRIVSEFDPLWLIIFGSRARDENSPGSDFDLLVVMELAPDKRKTAVEIRRLLADLPASKDIIVTTPEEISRRGRMIGTVLRAALREGKILYERN